MPDYFVLGGCLRSELLFPELAESTGTAASWSLTLGTLAAAGHDRPEAELGRRELSPTCQMRVTRVGDVYRYAHSCTGVFEVAANGRSITFDRSPNVDLDVARTDLVSRVLLLAIDRSSTLWLHGSAVSIGDGAIGFLGPSGAGKSTLALALAAAGRGIGHICDDTLPVDLAEEPSVRASDQVLRLCGDSRDILARAAHAIRRDSDGKFVVTQRAMMHACDDYSAGDAAGRFPLRTLYLLAPSVSTVPRTRDAPSTERRRLAPLVALAALMAHMKLGPAVATNAGEHVMRQLAAVARRVEVCELVIHRDLSRLDDVVREIVAWHSVPVQKAPWPSRTVAAP